MNEKKYTSKQYFEHIIKEMKYLEKTTKDITLEDFKKDEEKQKAVVWSLFMISDSVQEITRREKDIETKYPYIEWKNIYRFRDFVGHHYLGINKEVIWDVVKKDIPKDRISFETVYKHMYKEKDRGFDR